MKKLIKVLRDKRGFGYPLVAAVVLVALMLMMVGYEFMRIQVIASGVRNAVQSAVIHVAQENFEPIYGGLITGYSGGYELNGEDWLPSLRTGDIYKELDQLLGTRPEGGRHVKIAGDSKEFEIYGLTVDVQNTPLHPTGDETLAVLSKITLEVPVWFMGVQVDVMQADLVVATHLVPKF